MTSALALILLLGLQGGSAADARQVDPRDLYDVKTYRLDLRVDPQQEVLSGTVVMEAEVKSDDFKALVLDMKQVLEVQDVRLLEGELEAVGAIRGRSLPYDHRDDALTCELPEALAKGETLAVAVTYSGKPKAENGFSGFHWVKTPSGKPWVNTSCQGPGAHSWWPCKASTFNADDKHERLFINLTVPEGLYGVSNGRLTQRSQEEGWETFHWRHDYPCETYAVTINVAPYVVVESELKLPEIESPVAFVYYVLPEHEERARVQFKQVPELLEVYTKAFGSYPFPDSKFALVETNFWGMEHSTAVAYGSSFPAWCEANGENDPYAKRNVFFDYILVHEVAHEWWGNAVSAKDWGHFWIHEGFGTYAEGVYVEFTAGREEADRYFEGQSQRQGKKSRLYRGEDPVSSDAYSGVIYSKGALVLNTLRQYVNDDDTWWKSLRDFNLEYRYGNANTEEFQSILERNTGRSWSQFFEQWFYGEGYPSLEGEVSARAKSIRVSIDNEGSAETGFHVPLDLSWTEAGAEHCTRLMLNPGKNQIDIQCDSKPEGLAVVGLQRILGRHDIEID